MTERSDVTVDWGKSPRIITVAAPSTTITVQDLIDTLRSNTLQAGEADDSLDNMDDDFILDAEGKANDVTGVVAILQNAQLSFEQRTAKLETGTITTPDTTGNTLTDATATFITNGVVRGDIILNATDGSHATVLSVTSETVIEGTTLAGGTDNQYDSADAYEILDFDDCTVTGGDLFAVDDVGADLFPILNTFGTNVVVEQSTSPAAAGVRPTTALEGTLTWEQSQRLILAAAAAGDLSGAPAGPILIKDAATGLKTRITATVDGNGNRTIVIGDVS